MLEIKGLTAGYPGKTVLKDLSLSVPAGSVTAVIGPNGCGKSTLLKTACGLLPVSAGSVSVNGTPVLSLPGRERAQRIAYLPQERQIPEITALRMVLHGRFPYLSYPRRYRAEDLRIARESLSRMDLAGLEETPVGTLSGGMRQKVYIAMVLAQDTPAVLLDEPTTFLDVGHQLQMMEEAARLAKDGKAVLLVLHDLTLALQHCDRIAVMEDGRIDISGTAEEIWASGCIDRVFGVRLCRVETPNGWHYYCER
ncbi:MAG: ABC transporter ATP-binding protein [Oscillospiraceae bacterium]|nr:ABC transporter ATP-binding protein [Oscillospiraceae bacterium]